MSNPADSTVWPASISPTLVSFHCHFGLGLASCQLKLRCRPAQQLAGVAPGSLARSFRAVLRAGHPS
eukprot:9448240-Alexandrium_andersonii.AAC.1